MAYWWTILEVGIRKLYLNNNFTTTTIVWVRDGKSFLWRLCNIRMTRYMHQNSILPCEALYTAVKEIIDQFDLLFRLAIKKQHHSEQEIIDIYHSLTEKKTAAWTYKKGI